MPCLVAKDDTTGCTLHHLLTASTPAVSGCSEKLWRRIFRAPANVASNVLLGLEYLFSQSTGQCGPFSLQNVVNDGPGPEEEVIQPGQPDVDDEAYQSDMEAHEDVLSAILPHTRLISDKTAVIQHPACVSSCVSA